MVVMENDVVLVKTEFEDMVISKATEEAAAVMESRHTRVIFSENWVKTLRVVVSTVVQSLTVLLNAMVQRCDHKKYGRRANIHALRVLGTKFHDSSGMS